MSYDPTQQVPPPQGYPPQQPQAYPPQQPQAYPPQQQAYPQSQPQSYPQQPPAPATYAQYPSQPVGPTATAGGFDFNAFWRGLGLTGQVSGIAGVLIFIFFIFPWFTISIPAVTEGGITVSQAQDFTWNGFSSASGISENGVSIGSYFPYLWLVLLGALGLIALAVMVSQRRLSSRTAIISVIATSAVALALEICFLIEVGSFNHGSSSSGGTGEGAGFWLALIATLAALGAAIYGMIQARKPANPYQPAAAPYADPYQQQQQQYPGQYPGQQPPQYPGQ